MRPQVILCSKNIRYNLASFIEAVIGTIQNEIYSIRIANTFELRVNEHTAEICMAGRVSVTGMNGLTATVTLLLSMKLIALKLLIVE